MRSNENLHCFIQCSEYKIKAGQCGCHNKLMPPPTFDTINLSTMNQQNEESKLEHAALIKVKFEIGRVVLTNPDGDTYSSKSEDLIDFFHNVHLWQSLTTPASNEVEGEYCEYCEGKGWFINEDHPKWPKIQQKLDCYHCAPSKPHTVEEGQTQEPVGGMKTKEEIIRDLKTWLSGWAGEDAYKLLNHISQYYSLTKTSHHGKLD